MEYLKEFFDNTIYTQIVSSIVVIIIAIIIYQAILHFFEHGEKKYAKNKEEAKKRITYVKLFKSVLRYIIIIATILTIMQVNGVNISSLFAGLGIAGAIIGLAIQDWLKDIIRGSSIISDNYFSVGDIVKYNDIEGKVLVIGLKTTKIQELKTSNIISIANRKIEEIQIVSNKVYIEIPMPYETNLETAEKAITDIVQSIKNNNNVTDCNYRAVNELAESSINYFIEVNCNPENKLQVRRDALRTILDEMDKNNIKVPYRQIDIHEKSL